MKKNYAIIWAIILIFSQPLTTVAMAQKVNDTSTIPSCGKEIDPVLLVVTGTNENPEQFAKYAQALRSSGLYEKYQGYYEAIGDPIHVLEGQWSEPEFVVIARFPCRAALESFWSSPAYSKIKLLRKGTGDVRASIFKELPVPDRVTWSD